MSLTPPEKHGFPSRSSNSPPGSPPAPPAGELAPPPGGGLPSPAAVRPRVTRPPAAAASARPPPFAISGALPRQESWSRRRWLPFQQGARWERRCHAPASKIGTRHVPSGPTYARGKKTPRCTALLRLFHQRFLRAIQHRRRVPGDLRPPPTLPHAMCPYRASDSAPLRQFDTFGVLPRLVSRRRREWPLRQLCAELGGRLPPSALRKLEIRSPAVQAGGGICAHVVSAATTIRAGGERPRAVQSLPLSTIISTSTRVTMCDCGRGPLGEGSFDKELPPPRRERCGGAVAACKFYRGAP